MSVDAQAFLDKYGYPDFKEVNFRGEAAAQETVIFGPDYSGATGKSVRTHVARDRGHGNKWTIFAPFDIEHVEMYPNDDFGSMTVLYPVGADFTVRIAHMNPDTDMDPVLKLAIADKKSGFPAGTYIGKPGNYSIALKVGVHTHTEIVSIGESSAICDLILKNKYGETHWHDNPALMEWIRSSYAVYQKKWPEEGKPDMNNQILADIFDALRHDMSGRRVVKTSNRAIQKHDYLGEVLRTWYSSFDLFNI